MADQLTKERRSTGRSKITIKEATLAFRTALGDTEKPELIKAPAETTLIQHPRGGYVIKASGKMTAKSSGARSSGSAASSKTPTHSKSASTGTKSASTASRSAAGKSLSRPTSTDGAVAGGPKASGTKKRPAKKSTGSTRSRG